MNDMTRRFAVKIQGSNGSRAYATSKCGYRVFADTSGRTEGVLLRLEADTDDELVYGEERPVALFTSRESAREAGLAAHWSGQTFEVVVARGNARAAGRVVGRPADGWFSCQAEEVRS